MHTTVDLTERDLTWASEEVTRADGTSALRIVATDEDGTTFTLYVTDDQASDLNDQVTPWT